MFTNQFLLLAIAIGIFLATAAAVISPFLVLKGESMIADGLAHTSFLGFVLGLIINPDGPIWIAFLIAIGASLAINFLINKLQVGGDSMIAVIAATAFSIGQIIVQKSRGFNISIEKLISSQILTSTATDLYISLAIMVIIVGFVLIFYRPLYLITFESNPIKISKLHRTLLSYSLSILTAVLVVVGVRTIGTLLITAFIVFPTLIGIQFRKGFMTTIIIGTVSAILATFSGIILSYYLDFPTGATIILLETSLLLIIYVINSLIRRKTYAITHD